jgi:thymidylate synthase (FAD)
MEKVEPQAFFIWSTEKPLQTIEIIGRTCYKSEDKITPTSAEAFVKMILNGGHYAMIEHACASFKLICDRGVSHALVRHRLFSFAQESTQYCNYGKNKQMKFIHPILLLDDPAGTKVWENLCAHAEQAYLELIALGHKPETARSVLPTSVKTELVLTSNFRNWLHLFSLRLDPKEQRQIQDCAEKIYSQLRVIVPEIFCDTAIEKYWENLRKGLIPKQPAGVIQLSLFQEADMSEAEVGKCKDLQ